MNCVTYVDHFYIRVRSLLYTKYVEDVMNGKIKGFDILVENVMKN